MKNSIVSREEWLATRAELLLKEKAHTVARDQLSEARRNMPWVQLEKNYELMTTDGYCSLEDLFLGRSQLIVYHFMLGQDWDEPCVGCSQWADAFSGTTERFEKADARLIAVSRASIEKIAAVQERRSWRFTWASSMESDFNVDFYASSDDLENETRQVGAEEVEFDRGENHGISVFFKDESGAVFHTYSCYNRGVEPMNGSFGYYDLLPRGRAW
jgi:predicted dithiol-disulfide oxidoreductase (DUF899 family)